MVPTVRNTVVEFDDGKCAIALGDVHAIVDPMMGQGANVASYAAFVLGGGWSITLVQREAASTRS